MGIDSHDDGTVKWRWIVVTRMLKPSGRGGWYNSQDGVDSDTQDDGTVK